MTKEITILLNKLSFIPQAIERPEDFLRHKYMIARILAVADDTRLLQSIAALHVEGVAMIHQANLRFDMYALSQFLHTRIFYNTWQMDHNSKCLNFSNYVLN